MKKNIIFAVVALITGIASFAFYYNEDSISSSLSTEVKWENFDNGMRNAQQLNKKLIIDVYTDWCGWCKKMDKNTYSNKEVSDYINKNFIAIKLNAESKNSTNFMGQTYTEQQLAQGFGITGYPATIFFDEKQQPITVVPGYLESKDMLSILKYIKDDIYRTKSFEEYLKTSQN